MISDEKNLYFMKIAFKEAEKAYLKSEIPIGAILIHEDEIIKKSHNSTKKNPLDHAELKILIELQEENYEHFSNSTLYSTLEPCCMCISAAKICGIKKILYANSCKKWGGASIFESKLSKESIFTNSPLCCKIQIDNSDIYIKNFFLEKRKNYKK
jgi:tRNA(adenine34) deaminase